MTQDLLDLIREAREIPDDNLIEAWVSGPPDIADVARIIFQTRHRRDPVPKEPSHCGECFEGCPKYQPKVKP